jgi:SAM-dependent methyltransferase
MSRLLASRNPSARVIGVDINPGYVAYAQKRASEEGLTNLSFETGDLQDLAFDDRSFDVVWSQFVLYFLPDPEAALKEFRRLLKPGGTVLISLYYKPILTNYPEESALQGELKRVIYGLGDFDIAHKLPSMLQHVGFHEISVEIEGDRIYTKIGRIAPEPRRNVAEILGSGLPRIAETLGGPTEAEAFLADLLAYLDRPDTSSFTTLWIVKGVAPQN